MPENIRSRKYEEPTSSGPFEAIVVNHLDPKYMGTLQVELLKRTSSGNQPERTGQLIEAKYLSPFYGVTPLSSSSKNEGYKQSQKSYGMWAVPPDVGTRVLVILAEGSLSSAFWIGCIQDEYMNFMLPGYASTENLSDFGKKAPAAEYNKFTNSAKLKDPTKYPKPIHADLARSLIQQGLIDDDARGVSSSSARREVPSMVFGISTPGPLDKRPGAPKGDIGPVGQKANMHTNRLGGSSFVMDDGDDKFIRKTKAGKGPMEYASLEAGETDGDPTVPANECIRLKTRTGHQILLHNSEDLIYIGNAKGTAWIELTSNGKIDIYAQDSISVHTAVDMNFTADRDINFVAGQNLNMVIGSNYKISAGAGINNIAGTNINSSAGGSITGTAGENISNFAVGSATHISTGVTNILSAGEMYIGTTAGLNLDACGDFKLNADGEGHIKIISNMYINSDAETHIKSEAAMKIQTGSTYDLNASAAATVTASTIDLNGPTAASATAATPPGAPQPIVPLSPLKAAIASRVPQHEPWLQHENLNPQEYSPQNTRADSDTVDTYVPRVPDTFAKTIGVPSFQPNNSTSSRASAPVISQRTNVTGNVGVSTSGKWSGTAAKLPPETVQTTEKKKARSQIFAQKLRDYNFTDEEILAAIACANTESKILPAQESTYKNTSNDRIRSIFVTATRGISDAVITEAKQTRETFFELVYGNGNSIGRGMGNLSPGDGGKYFGRGLIQLTGKANYAKYAEITGQDILTNPEWLLSKFDVTCDVAAAYLSVRYKRNGGRGVLGDMRIAIAGTEGGYNLGYPKDVAFYNTLDVSWTAEPTTELLYASVNDPTSIGLA